MKFRKSLSFSLCTLSWLTVSAFGNLIVNDAFDYGGADLESGYGSWDDGTSNNDYESSVTASWSGDADYLLNGAGGSLTSGSFNTLRISQLNLGQSLTGTFWLSALIRDDSVSGGNGAVIAFEAGPYSYDIASVDGDGWGVDSAANLYSVDNGTAWTDTGIDLSTSTWLLHVAKITVNGSGADDALDLWVFDSTSAFDNTEAGLGAATYSSATLQFGDDITAVAFGTYDAGPNPRGYLDNLRISSRSDDFGLQEVLTGAAVPEPATYALLLGILAGFLILRRRIKH